MGGLILKGNMGLYRNGATYEEQPNGMLDGLSAATKTAIVHLSGGRRLLKTYPSDGALIRARRSTDNAETDIGVLANGQFDAAAAASFAGSGDLFVVTGYDQSGGARNLTQGTATAQPGLSITPTGGRRNINITTRDMTGWGGFRSTNTLTSTPVVDGTGFFTRGECNATNTNGTAVALRIYSATSPSTFTMSVDVRSDPAGGWLCLRPSNNANFTDRVNVWFDPATGEFGQATASGASFGPTVTTSAVPLSGGGWRVTMTFTVIATIELSVRHYVVDANNNLTCTIGRAILLGRPQLELGSTATAYQSVNASGTVVFEPERNHLALMVFDGSDQFERPASDFPSNLHTLSGVTVAARVSTSNPTLSAAVWSMRDNSTGFIAFGRNTAGTLYIFHTSNAGVSRSASSTVTLPANQSANVIAEWDFVAARARLWMNGVLIITLTNLDIAGGLTARRHWLGATRTTDIVARWTGPISTPFICGTVLTDAERQTIENALAFI
jgi:hypothetical protein